MVDSARVLRRLDQSFLWPFGSGAVPRARDKSQMSLGSSPCACSLLFAGKRDPIVRAGTPATFSPERT